MIRGTTPTLTFTLPMDCSELQEAYVTFVQNGNIVLDKSLVSCQQELNKLIIKLTQTETLKLVGNELTEVQLRVKTKDGTALASKIWKVETGRILKEGEI